ncbi:hypothetical protein EAX61_14100 [Dokdonia sinensis]|uniref:DUF975 family protein n=1 Tax=Dokdonia sinensis TaxID=2479847 RepID=A0A3M0FX59_9FLAO|nr:hypothetical protein [Dokdonia sinensis]RMB56537.1 hypothetical protein EAX61_14100 [Dokdonia sinensis]
MNYHELKEKIRQNNNISIGETLSESFNLYGSIFGNGLLLQVLTILVLYGLVILTYIPMMGSVFIMEDQVYDPSDDTYTVIGILWLILYFFIYVIVAIFQVGLLSAFYNIMRLKDRGIRSKKGVNFGMFFKKQYFLKLTLIGVINLLMIGIGSILFVVPLFYVIIPVQFVVLLFAFNPELSVKQLYGLAFTLGTKKWGTTFLPFALLALIASLGIFVCGIGILATASLALVPAYLIYKGVIGFYEDEEAIASIGDPSLIETGNY